MKQDANAQMEALMREIPADTPLLLQACCGPCASGVLPRLAGHFRVSLFWCNPNIAPIAEHERRLQTLRRLLAQMPQGRDIPLLEAPYDEAAFLAAAAGLENAPEGGARCAACFRLRLEATARKAAQLGIGWFATTLSVSPHKNAPLLNAIGSEAAKAHGLRFLPADFKKKDGYRRSLQLSAEYGLYRQTYCGCRFSFPAPE